MDYCQKIGRNFYCDWNNQFYGSLRVCEKKCAYYTLNNEPVKISKSDFLVIGAFAGVLFGAVFLFALFKSLISG